MRFFIVFDAALVFGRLGLALAWLVAFLLLGCSRSGFSAVYIAQNGARWNFRPDFICEVTSPDGGITASKYEIHEDTILVSVDGNRFLSLKWKSEDTLAFTVSHPSPFGLESRNEVVLKKSP